MSTKTAEVSVRFSKTPEVGESSTWMAGFFPLGLLLGMLGSLVISWHYHTDAEPKSIGLHFLGIGIGFIFASQIFGLKVLHVPLRKLAISSTTVVVISLVALSFLAPPIAAWWRIGALALAGAASGGLACSLLYANHALFENSPARSANYAGALFVGGALLATVVAGVTYFDGSPKAHTALLAFVPAAYLILLARRRKLFALEPPLPRDGNVLRITVKDLHSIAAILFSLLVLFQFACEWAIASWLPLFLIHTMGISPVTAIGGLGLYFLALISGRLVAQPLLPLISHKKMLLFSVALAMAGYLVLSFTNSTVLALISAVVVGLGHAPIYPLVAERLRHRLFYHSGFYSGRISIAIAAAMATPWLLSYLAEAFGMAAVMLIPAIASIVVLILAILIMFESRLMGGKRTDSSHGLMASDL